MAPVSLILSDGTVYGEKGRIETVNGQINTATGTVNIRAKFPNQSRVIRSGSSGTVRIPDNLNDAILIPQSATFELQNKRFAVLAGKDGKTQTVSLTVMDNSAGNFYVVKSGLKPGDQVVLEGVSTLKDGTDIKANPQQAETVYADLK